MKCNNNEKLPEQAIKLCLHYNHNNNEYVRKPNDERKSF